MSVQSPNDESDTVDVLIIGAGAAGATMAWSLAETRMRMRIVCLEQGGWMRPDGCSTLANCGSLHTPP